MSKIPKQNKKPKPHPKTGKVVSLQAWSQLQSLGGCFLSNCSALSDSPHLVWAAVSPLLPLHFRWRSSAHRWKLIHISADSFCWLLLLLHLQQINSEKTGDAVALCSETFPIWHESDAQQHLHPSSHACSMVFKKLILYYSFFRKAITILNVKLNKQGWSFYKCFFSVFVHKSGLVLGPHSVISIAKVPQNEIKKI